MLKNLLKHIDIHECVWILLELCILLYPIGLKCIQDTDISFIVTSIIFALPLVLLLATWNNAIWRHCIVAISALCSMIETTMVVLYKGFITSGNILAVLTTNHNEATGFALHSLRVIWYYVPVIVFAALAIWGYSTTSLSDWKRKWISLVISIVVSCGYVGYKQYSFYKGVLTLRFYITNRILNRPPYNIGYQFYNACKMQQQRKYIELSNNMTYSSIKNDTLSQKEIYVLGIGESMRYENFSLNGTYPRKTTPSLSVESNVILYTNYYSESCLTMWSVPMLLTRATPFDFETNYKEKAIFKPFMETGFKAYTITNYDNLLKHETYLSKGNDGLIEVQHDSIIPHVIDSLASINDKLFIIFQFIGNHHPYWNYTMEFDKYHPNIHSEPHAKSDSLYINAYDNTYLYIDHLLARIIHTIQRDSTISSFIYVSDHGQHVETNGGGHGGDCKPKKVEYHVPMVVWYSDSWADVYPKKLRNMKAHKDDPVNGDNIFYSLIDMANITIDDKYAHTSWSVFSDTLEYHERYVLLPDGVNVFKTED